MARWPITATSPTIDHLGNLNGIEESAYNLNTAISDILTSARTNM